MPLSLPTVSVYSKVERGVPRSDGRRDFRLSLAGASVATVLGREDYDGVAAALGARGFRIARPDEVEGTLADALRVARSGTPVLVNVHIGLTDFRKGAISL